MKLVIFAFLLMVMVAQEPPAKQTCVLRLNARIKLDGAEKLRALQRKRFFLIPGTLEQNRALIDAIERQSLISRDCYYQKLGASAALINWLRKAIANRSIVAVSKRILSLDPKRCLNL
jgi:hypothetical protein